MLFILAGALRRLEAESTDPAAQVPASSVWQPLPPEQLRAAGLVDQVGDGCDNVGRAAPVVPQSSLLTLTNKSLCAINLFQRVQIEALTNDMSGWSLEGRL